jgi:predicted PurR-regulated permease PerM
MGVNRFRYLLYFGIFLLILAVLYYFLTVVVYLSLAIVITLVGRPLANAFCRLRIGRFQLPSALAAVLTLLSFYLLLAIFIGLFVPLILTEIELIKHADPNQLVQQFKQPMDEYSLKLKNLGANIDLYQSTQNYAKRFFDAGFATRALDQFIGIISSVGDIITMVFAVSFIAFFMLKDSKLLDGVIEAIIPDAYEDQVGRILVNSQRLLRRYFIGILVQTSIVSTLYFIGFKLAGFQNAFIIAFIVGLFNIIPFVGPLIGIAFGLFMALSMHLTAVDGIWDTLVHVGIVFGIVQGLDNVVFQPIIFSSSVKAHPIETFLVVLMGARLGGILGMLLAIPTYTVFRVVLKETIANNKLVNKIAGHL